MGIPDTRKCQCSTESFPIVFRQTQYGHGSKWGSHGQWFPLNQRVLRVENFDRKFTVICREDSHLHGYPSSAGFFDTPSFWLQSYHIMSTMI